MKGTFCYKPYEPHGFLQAMSIMNWSNMHAHTMVLTVRFAPRGKHNRTHPYCHSFPRGGDTHTQKARLWKVLLLTFWS